MKNFLITNLLTKNGIDALLISSTANIAYLTNYFGFSDTEREAYILITKKQNYLFTDGRYIEAVRRLQDFLLQEITSKLPFIKLLKALMQTHAFKTLGIEEQDLRVKEYLMIKKLPTAIKPLSLRALRMIKTSEEIELIKRACEIADTTYTTVLKTVKEGMTEKEIGNLIESEIKKQKADISFRPIVAFNEHAATPHHLTDDRKLTAGSIILMDFGAQYKGYYSDMTRTIFFGKPPEEQKNVYQVVLTAQEKAVEYLNHELRSMNYDDNFITYSSSERSESRSNNETIKQSSNSSRWSSSREISRDSNNKSVALNVDKVAREHIISQGYPTIPHSLGHGIGIQVHEAPTLSPTSKDELAEGMVFSIEPGIYLPGKFGVRIEDLFAIQNGTLVQLTKSPSKLHVVSD